MSCQLFPLIGYPLLCFILGASLAAWWWPLLASSAFLLASSRPRESLYGRRRRDTRFKSLSILFDWQHRACAPIFSRVVPARGFSEAGDNGAATFVILHLPAIRRPSYGLRNEIAPFQEDQARPLVEKLQERWADRWRGGYDRQSLLSVNSLPFCVTVDERSPSCSPSNFLCLAGFSGAAAVRLHFRTYSVVVWLQFSVKQPQLVRSWLTAARPTWFSEINTVAGVCNLFHCHKNKINCSE